MRQNDPEDISVRGALGPARMYLLFDVVDLSSQPLDHPIRLGDLLFGVAEIITVPASCDLELLILTEPEQSQSTHQTLAWALPACPAWPLVL